MNTAQKEVADQISPHLRLINQVAPSQTASPKNVVMLVINDCINDSRVIKSAETLAAVGHSVTVICRLTPRAEKYEVVRGVVYRRVAIPVMRRKLSKMIEDVERSEWVRRPSYLKSFFFLIFGALLVCSLLARAAWQTVGEWLGGLNRALGRVFPFPGKVVAWVKKSIRGGGRHVKRLLLRTRSFVKSLLFRFVTLMRATIGYMKQTAHVIAKPLAGHLSPATRHRIARVPIGIQNVLRRKIRRAVRYYYRRRRSRRHSRRRGLLWFRFAWWPPRFRSLRRWRKRRFFRLGRFQRWNRLKNTISNFIFKYFVERPFAPVFTYNFLYRAFRDYIVVHQPDVIHAHDLNTMPAAFAGAKRTGAKVVYDAHELAILEVPNENFVANRYKRWVHARLVPQVAGIVTVSRGFVRLFDEWFPQSPKVVVYNTPSFHIASSLNRDVRSDLGLSNDIPLAVYIGGLNPRRGLFQLVESLAYAPEMIMVKVGPRNENYERMMAETAEKYGVTDRLLYLDPVPSEEIVHYCRTGDFGIVTRLKISIQQEYSMPNKLFESVFAGLPIIAGDTEEIREFVNRFKVGVMMDTYDPKDIARAMREVYARRDELRPSAERIREINDEYGWEAQQRNLIGLYEKILAA